MPTRHMPQLDGIRAVAIAAVLAYHACYGYVQAGFLGVDLFFVLSGFLITSLLIDEFERFGSFSFRLFYLRRFLRLYPALLVLLILSGIFWSHIASRDASFPGAASAILFSYANLGANDGPLGHTWSLSMEEQFYIVWPFLLLLSLRVGRWRLLPATGIFCLAVLVRNLMLLHHVPPAQIIDFPLARMDALMGGVFVAFAVRRPAVVAFAAKFPRRLGAVSASALTVTAVLFFVVHESAHALYVWGFSAIALLFGLLVGSSALHAPAASWTNRLLSSAPMVYLGRRSYGIYLYHAPIFLWLEQFRVHHSIGNFAVITLLRIGLSIAVAAASYRFVELPILALKSRFERSKARNAAVEAAF